MGLVKTRRLSKRGTGMECHKMRIHGNSPRKHAPQTHSHQNHTTKKCHVGALKGVTCSRVAVVIGSRAFRRVFVSTCKHPITAPVFIFSSSLRHSRCRCMSRRISRTVLHKKLQESLHCLCMAVVHLVISVVSGYKKHKH
jgi:hypothetical protein